MISWPTAIACFISAGIFGALLGLALNNWYERKRRMTPANNPYTEEERRSMKDWNEWANERIIRETKLWQDWEHS